MWPSYVMVMCLWACCAALLSWWAKRSITATLGVVTQSQYTVSVRPAGWLSFILFLSSSIGSQLQNVRGTRVRDTNKVLHFCLVSLAFFSLLALKERVYFQTHLSCSEAAVQFSVPTMLSKLKFLEKKLKPLTGLQQTHLSCCKSDTLKPKWNMKAQPHLHSFSLFLFCGIKSQSINIVSRKIKSWTSYYSPLKK